MKDRLKSKSMRIFNYVLLAIFTLITGVAAGLPKIFLSESMVTNMGLMGYPNWAIVLIGVAWVLVNIGMWIKKTRLCSLLVASWILAGATAAHIATIGTIPFPYPIFGYYVILAVLFYINGFCDRICDK